MIRLGQSSSCDPGMLPRYGAPRIKKQPPEQESAKLEAVRAEVIAKLAANGCTTGWLVEKAQVCTTAAVKFLVSVGAVRSNTRWKSQSVKRKPFK